MSPPQVFLIGAGPGHEMLHTARARWALASADVILYDRLVAPETMRGLEGRAELEYVGKEPGRAALSQEEINALLVEHARAGRRVARLKGGDPFVFGRGGEEAEALAAAGIAFEVVPGVTAGIAAPAYAGIPVTHRDLASAVAFVTGHEDPEKHESAVDWPALAAFPGTLVFYMGVRNLERIAAELVGAGRRADEPAAVIASGTTPRQRTVVGTLQDIARRAQGAGIAPPAVTVVGEVVTLRERIAWFEAARPLLGKSVVVTRARGQASAVAAELAELGAFVVQAPAIRIEPIASADVDRAVGDLAAYSLVCLTSPNGAEQLMARFRDGGGDARSLAGTKFAAVGRGTAESLALYAIHADVVADRSVGEGLVEVLAQVAVEGRRVLVARAESARDVVPDALRERGAQVDVVAVYRTVKEPLGEQQIAAAERADYVTFTSSSTVRNFVDEVGDRFPRDARVVSIGPQTSATARELGLEVHVEAAQHDPEGLVAALLADAEERA